MEKEIILNFDVPKRIYQMAQYAIAFDLDTHQMRENGLTNAEITTIYQTEIPDALRNCGFTVHAQGSLYHTAEEQNPINAIMQLQNTLRQDAPRFCQYVKTVHVFRMEEWSDVTELIANRPPNPTIFTEDIITASEIYSGTTQQ